MKKFLLTLISSLTFVVVAHASNHTIINIDIGDGQKVEASFFSVKSKKATIFVPGKIFDKTSWHFLASKLQDKNIASLSIDGKYPAYVVKSIEILNKKGFDTIYLVGGSMGGSAVLNSIKDVNDTVKKVVVLAPFGGEPIKSTTIDKLFIVAKDDFMGSDTYTFFEQSSQKKRLKEYDSSEHAQHLFNGKYKEDLTKIIVDFLSQ